MHVERFEPVYLVPDGPARLTEVGKRWADRKLALIGYFADIFRDLAKLTPRGLAELAHVEMDEWDPRLRGLADAGIPMMASGIGQSILQKVLDYLDGKTTTAFSPASMNGCLGTAAPTTTTTGAWGATESSNYTSYARLSITPSTAFNASTGATPSVVTNATALQWAGCTGGSATENGFLLTDNNAIGSGAAYFWGAFGGGVTVDSTHTPPTIAIGNLSLSLNST